MSPDGASPLNSSPAGLYRELQAYVGWTEADAERVAALGPLVEAELPPLIDDFYEQIDRHESTRRVITGGPEQVDRLKGSLLVWVRELLGGRYDTNYVERRWRVGFRHVEIGLPQVYTNVALSRLRVGLVRAVERHWPEGRAGRREALVALNRLLDLDLAIIEDAYQTVLGDRLQRHERLLTLGQIAGGVAHELRNPLNVMKTSVYYLRHARQPSAEKTAEHLQRIERHIGVADGVITALSTFAKLPPPALQRTALEPVVGEALELNPPGPDVAVTLELAPDLPAILADADQLRIVLGNLIRNACDAMAEAGDLTIRARAEANLVRLEVVDSGTGIAPDHLQRILEPLYSTKTRGLGLGLAIVRTILDKSGARLEIESVQGQGSTFRVVLPAAEPEDSSPPGGSQHDAGT